MGDPDLDVDVGSIEGAEVIEQAEIGVSDPDDDVIEQIRRCEVVSGPAEIDFIGLQQVAKVEAKGFLDVCLEAVTDKTIQVLPLAADLRSDKALDEREGLGIRLAQMDEPEPADSIHLDWLRSRREKLTAQALQLCGLKATHEAVILVARDQAVDELGFEE